MKRLTSILALALLAFCAPRAAAQAVNTLAVSNSLPSTNFIVGVVGNRLVRLPLTNSLTIQGASPVTLGSTLDVTGDVFFRDAAYVTGDLTVTGEVVGASSRFTGEVAAQSFRSSDTNSPGALTLSGTNGNAVVTRAAPTNSVHITNLVGLVHLANASVLTLDVNVCQRWLLTNRLAQNTTLVWTNYAQGQRARFMAYGAASGGSDYYVTNIFVPGTLVVDSLSTNTPAATSRTLFVQDGTKLEVDIEFDRFLSATNVANLSAVQPVF